MLKTQRIKLDKLAPNIGQIPGLPMNPRNWTDEDVERIAKSLRETPELFEARPIIAVPFDGKNVILGGNLRFEGAKANGDETAPVVLIPADTPVEKMREIVIKDNGTFGQWDTEALLREWDNGLLNDWGVPGKIFANDADTGNSQGEQGEKYTRKIETPIYEPKGEKPEVSELYDRTKADALIAEIKQARIPADLRDFLIAAAERHTVFNYDKIAEFYAQSTGKIQGLFERSALVIIDFGDAIGGGYVKMCESIIEQYKIENDCDD